MSAKEKLRRRRKAQWMGLCVLLFFAELVAAAAPAALVIPTGYAARGGPAMGGESLAIAVTFTVAYAVIHNFVCNKLEEVTGSETGR